MSHLIDQHNAYLIVENEQDSVQSKEILSNMSVEKSMISQNNVNNSDFNEGSS